MSNKVELGFVGVGRMGGPMTERLLEAGYSLTIFDPDASQVEALVKKGAKKASSAAEVASAADIVLVSLPTPDIVRNVALGEKGIARGNRVRTLIDLSTTGPGVSNIVAKELTQRNIAWVDSPVSGGVKGAIAGTLAVMVSCPKPVFEEIEPILKVFGKIFFTGEKPGLAQSAKLANNLMAAVAPAIPAEAGGGGT